MTPQEAAAAAKARVAMASKAFEDQKVDQTFDPKSDLEQRLDKEREIENLKRPMYPAYPAVKEEEPRPPETIKTYHTRIPNSTFIAKKFRPDGSIIIGEVDILQFRGDSLEVEDAQQQAQLDAIADKPGCPIYIANKSSSLVDANLPANEVKARAAQVVEQIAASGQHISS